MSDRKYFPCGFCGTEYSSLTDRMECERMCSESRRLELENEKHNQLVIKTEKMIEEINELDKKIDNLKKERNEKYTEYSESLGYPIYHNKRVNDTQLLKNILDTIRF